MSHSVFRLLLVMGTCLDPHGLPEHAAIMAPIHQLKVHVLSRQPIPRAIEDHQAQDAFIRISRMWYRRKYECGAEPCIMGLVCGCFFE